MRITTVVLFILLLAAGLGVYQRQKHQGRDNAAQAAALSEALTMQARVSEQADLYFLREGRWPASHEALRLPPPESWASAQLRSLTLEEAGRVVVAFQRFPQVPDAWVRSVSEAGHRRCETNIPFIDRFATGCRYVRL